MPAGPCCYADCGNAKVIRVQGLRLGDMRVGVFGATGQVGGVMRTLLKEHRFPISEVRYFACGNLVHSYQSNHN